MRVLFFVCDGVLHPSRRGVPAQHRQATAASFLDAGYFQWSAHLAEALEGYNDVVLVNECDWGAKLKQRTFLQCLGPSARWFAGALDSNPASMEGARALFLQVAHPADWVRILPGPQPANAGRVLLVDPEQGISAAAAKHSFHRHWHKEPA